MTITSLLLILLGQLGSPEQLDPRVVLMGVEECARTRADDKTKLEHVTKLAVLCSKDLQLVEIERDALTSSIAVLVKTLGAYRAAAPVLTTPCPSLPVIEPDGVSSFQATLSIVAAAAGAGAGAALGSALAPEGRGPVIASLGAILGGLAVGWITLAALD